MKVLVINASANKERSTTLKLTKTFLEGLDVEASEVEFVTTIGLNINPCRACYACWFKTSGKCVQFNSPLMYIDADGVAHHYGYEEGTKKTILISTAGLPNI